MVELGVATFLGAAIVPFTTTSTANDDETQYVVRAGVATAKQLAAGTDDTRNGYGFSVQTYPGISVDELARGGYFKNKQISVTKLQLLEAIPGVEVNWPTPGRGDYHGTVNVTNPPPPGLFDAISAIFRQRTNPYPIR